MPEERGEKDDEQVAVRHADAPGGYIMKNQHEEKRKRDIQVNERESEATDEEQTNEWRKTIRFEQEAPNTSASSDPCVALGYPASGETQSRPGSALVQKSVHIDDDIHISALDAFHGKDGRRSRSIGEVLERGADAGDLKRIELVDKWTCLNVFEKKNCKLNPKILIEEKSWKTWKSNPNIVMDEELVQNFVIDAKIDPKVVMDHPIFKISGWNILRHSERNCWKSLLRKMNYSCCLSEF